MGSPGVWPERAPGDCADPSAKRNHAILCAPRSAGRFPSAAEGTGRVRYGYRRLTVLLKREGWKVNAKRVYRVYSEEGLKVPTKPRKKLASRARVPLPGAVRPNQRWSMDFIQERTEDGRSFRVLSIIDQFTRECGAPGGSVDDGRQGGRGAGAG